MQFASVNGITIHHQVIGAPEGKPTLVFSNSLGTDFRIWRDVIVRLAGEVAIVTYDLRGHGLSDVGAGADGRADTGGGAPPYAMADHVADLAGLLDHLGAERSVIVGLSVGGAVAQGLAVERPDLVAGLVLAGTAARFQDDAYWNDRIARVEADGLPAFAPSVIERWFGAAYKRAAGPAVLAGWRNMVARQPQAGYVGTAHALRDFDGRGQLTEITAPAIAIAGENDLSCPPADMVALARAMPDCRFEQIAACGHILPVENPELFAEIVLAFLADAQLQ